MTVAGVHVEGLDEIVRDLKAMQGKLDRAFSNSMRAAGRRHVPTFKAEVAKYSTRLPRFVKASYSHRRGLVITLGSSRDWRKARAAREQYRATGEGENSPPPMYGPMLEAGVPAYGQPGRWPMHDANRAVEPLIVADIDDVLQDFADRIGLQA